MNLALNGIYRILNLLFIVCRIDHVSKDGWGASIILYAGNLNHLRSKSPWKALYETQLIKIRANSY